MTGCDLIESFLPKKAATGANETIVYASCKGTKIMPKYLIYKHI